MPLSSATTCLKIIWPAAAVTIVAWGFSSRIRWTAQRSVLPSVATSSSSSSRSCSSSGPAERWDNALGAWSSLWYGPVVCLPQVPFLLAARCSRFLYLDFDVAFRHADVVARDGSLCRRTDDV